MLYSRSTSFKQTFASIYHSCLGIFLTDAQARGKYLGEYHIRVGQSSYSLYLGNESSNEVCRVCILHYDLYESVFEAFSRPFSLLYCFCRLFVLLWVSLFTFFCNYFSYSNHLVENLVINAVLGATIQLKNKKDQHDYTVEALRGTTVIYDSFWEPVHIQPLYSSAAALVDSITRFRLLATYIACSIDPL